ncbi:HNH endonuclease [Arsenicibacter rosenii]|uniref:HNH endonuclease n=1 Tax=Arsenicibacter rosenii TaxID=1750698 RepID=A0A1S2VKL8_9BACT|nr:HNH endonuclease [Arsenicibacter rosenii]OIN58950.1 HNH endonuclease [Arsenicibacter rosenii]
MDKTPGSKEKLKAFLLNNVGKVVDSNRLREVAGSSEWGRRIRELRNEEGFDIITHKDRSDLKPGQYILVSAEKKDRAFQRNISKETRAFVIDRDGNTCQMCGVAAGEIHPFDGRPARMQLGHVVDKTKGGTDDADNLRLLCSVCNEGASNLTLVRPDSISLLIQTRRAPKKVQLEVLAWLIKKFPKEAQRIQSS